MQVGDVLGGTLPGAHDDEPGGRGAFQAVGLRQQFRGVPDALTAFHTLGHEGTQPRTDDEVAGAVDREPLPRPDRHIQVLHGSVADDRRHADDLMAVETMSPTLAAAHSK
ncbi:hypothetical protein SANTM175S_07579 [Streptomyces antimycoticus]